MVVSRARIERLRREADTIFTRIDTVSNALEEARASAGDHWESRQLSVTLETPGGEEIALTLDLDESAAENAQRRYEHASELEAELEARREDAGELATLPADPVAVLVLAHLGEAGPTPSRRIAAAIDTDHDRVHDLCEELTAAGVFDRDDDGTAVYRLAEAGESMWDHLGTREGKAALLSLVAEMETLAHRLWRGGPDYPNKTASHLGMDRDRVRTFYAAMRAVGLVEPYQGSIIKGTERKLSPKDETHKKHTYYVTTTVTDRVLRERE